MDIANYLSELLEQLGEVNVPGLGRFTRVKVDGFYNNDEGRFYPPVSKIQFDREYVDDDVLAQYIGVKKRISLASSKYFTEKYISGLRQEIMLKEVPFADLGSLYFEDGGLCFKVAPALPDTAFYGYPQIALNKLSAEPVYQQEQEVTAEPIPVPEPEPVEEAPAPVLQDEPAIPDEPIQDEHVTEEQEPVHEEPAVTEHSDYFTPQPAVHTPPAEEDDDFIFHSASYTENAEEEEYDEPRRSYRWLWITLLCVLIAGGAVFAYLYLQPQETNTTKKIKPVPAATPDTTDSTAPGSGVKGTPVVDSTAKKQSIAASQTQNAPASTIDSTKRRYEVIGAETRTLAEANKVIENFKSLELTAHIVSDAPGKRKKISLGTYYSKAEAIAAVNDLIKTRKVKGPWTLTINPKQ